MTGIRFAKMSGAGNDFVVFDNREGRVELTPDLVSRWCDRHFGIGADGVLAVEKSPGANADFRMRYFNADGGEAEMCGNGARCFVRFVQPFPRAETGRVRFLTPAGLIEAAYLDGVIRVELTPPRGLLLAQTGDFGWGAITYHLLDTGVPHAVVFVENTEAVDVIGQGRAIRYSPLFARGTNVNFVQVRSDSNLNVRTYERGVEGETLACGTGVTAAALIAHRARGLALPIRVHVRGGDVLTVEGRWAEGEFTNVALIGPAETCFTGEIDFSS